MQVSSYSAWFVTLSVGLLIVLLSLLYQARLRQIAHQFNVRLEERVGERMRIAQELHDTLLQNITGLSLQISGLAKSATASESVKEHLLHSESSESSTGPVSFF